MKEKKQVGKYIRVAAVFAIWVVIVIACIIYREHITVENIVKLIPQNSPAAILVILLLFALKSVTVFVYSGLLYAASGILFSLPQAVIANVIGTVVMASIPFLVGRKAGSARLRSIEEKDPRLDAFCRIKKQKPFFVCLLVRLIGIFPSDIVGIYFGASGMKYRTYICGTVLGLLPMVVCFSVMGMSIDDVGSPEFIISAAVETAFIIISFVSYFIWKARQRRKKERG